MTMFFMEYRQKGITEKQMILNRLNPDSKGNGIRKFSVNSEDIGTDDIELIFEMSKVQVPDENWELHKVYSVNPEAEMFNGLAVNPLPLGSGSSLITVEINNEQIKL
jgi:hypothetical protein